MALPADFNKIYGSTATGGLTPISDVNYAKGWEFVGANPPTKNDFSYLQNLSDLKSQWLYSNKLQRTDPFGDIKSDGTVQKALENLGLGGGAKLNAATATLGRAGFIAIPAMIDGIEQSVIIQWGIAAAGTGGTGGTGNRISFPVAFPSECAQVITSYDNGSTQVVAGAAGNLTTTQFILRCSATGGTYNFRWLAVGY